MIVVVLIVYMLLVFPSISVSTDTESQNNVNSDLFKNISSLKIPKNKTIERCVKYYTEDQKTHLSESLMRGKKYFPIIIDEIKTRNLPRELAWIPVIESAFLIEARSNNYAAGIWQLMPFTARSFGLTVDKWVDERLDPWRSTKVAFDALEYFHKKLGCWLLAIAAYNTGEGRIFDAIEQTKSRNFWVLADMKKIPSQTRFYVPAVLAIDYIYRNSEKYSLQFEAINDQSWANITISEHYKIKDLSRCAQTDVETFRSWNPALRKCWTPKTDYGYNIRVPADIIPEFLMNFSHLESITLANLKAYEVKRGDTLYKIAKKFGLDIDLIKQINNMTNNLIYPHDILMIPAISFKSN